MCLKYAILSYLSYNVLHITCMLIKATVFFRYGRGSFDMSQLIQGLTAGFDTQFDFDEVCH